MFIKDLSLLLINALSIFMVGDGNIKNVSDTPLKYTFSVNIKADSTKSKYAGEYTGNDPKFVAGQKMAAGFLMCSNVKNRTDGNFVMLIYRSDRKHHKVIAVSDSLIFGDYSKQKGMTPIKVMVSNSEVHGSKILFSLSAADVINWKGEKWKAIVSVYGKYDTSDGKYSIQVYQYTPDHIN